MPRGFCGIGVENGKFSCNLGTLFRTAQAFDVNFIFTIGNRYTKSATRGDTCKSWKNIPLFHYDTFEDFYSSMPKDAKLVGIENVNANGHLKTFRHPERAVYLLGAEDWGLSEAAMEKCDYIVDIPTQICLNVATTGSIVIYDRMSK